MRKLILATTLVAGTAFVGAGGAWASSAIGASHDVQVGKSAPFLLLARGGSDNGGGSQGGGSSGDHGGTGTNAGHDNGNDKGMDKGKDAHDNDVNDDNGKDANDNDANDNDAVEHAAGHA
jgi:hypothetical protein